MTTEFPRARVVRALVGRPRGGRSCFVRCGREEAVQPNRFGKAADVGRQICVGRTCDFDRVIEVVTFETLEEDLFEFRRCRHEKYEGRIGRDSRVWKS